MLSQVVFDEQFFKDLLGAQGTKSYDWRNVIKFLHLKGAITKFVLRLPHDIAIDAEDINHWFLFLSGKGIKDVTLENIHDTALKLPAQLFSCLELKHLNLRNCCFHPPPGFRGFPNLLNLRLNDVQFESYKCRELVTCCPLLEILNICVDGLFSNVSSIEITKLENLKMLTVLSSNIDAWPLTSSIIVELVGLLSKLQELMLVFDTCKFLAEADTRKVVPTKFPCLKALKLLFIDFDSDIMVSYVFNMICCFPNLQTLRILATDKSDVPPPALCSSDIDYNTMGLLQLRRLVFVCSKGSENELCFIKSLLARSPLLKKISIGLNSSSIVDSSDGRLKFAEKLLKLHRASLLAEIHFIYFSY